MAFTFRWDDDDARFVLEQQSLLDLYNVSSMKQQSAGRSVPSIEHIILLPIQPVFARTL
jgi:hypothetical protein